MKDKRQFISQLEARAAEYRARDSGESGGLQKMVAEWLGVEPWKVVLPVALAVGLLMVLLLRGWAVKGVSWMQWGF